MPTPTPSYDEATPRVTRIQVDGRGPGESPTAKSLAGSDPDTAGNTLVEEYQLVKDTVRQRA